MLSTHFFPLYRKFKVRIFAGSVIRYPNQCGMRDGKNVATDVKRLKGMLNQLAKQIEARLDKPLFITTTGALQKLLIKISADTDPTSKVDYAETLIAELLAVATEPITDLSERVEEILWEYNFNSRQYFLFYIKRIAEKIQAEETIGGKFELLAFELKKVNQQVMERNMGYTTTYSSLSDVVGNWLSEEMAFLRTKQQLTITFSQSDKVSQDFKIALDLSVAQFSCLVRGLMEKKYILNSNLTELAGFLSNSVITKRSENISVGSFRKKYYNLEEGTKKSVIDMLNKVIDWLLRN